MYDVVVVGGGHNGVVAASVLALAGLRVALVERNYLLGGLAGGRVLGGAGGSRFAYAIGLVPRVLDELLGLTRGVVVYSEPSWVELEEDGSVWLRWWRDPGRLRAELREAGLGGLWELEELASRTWRCMERLGLVYTASPPSRWEAARLLEERCGAEEARLVEKPADRLLGGLVPRWAWDLVIYPSMLHASGFVLAYYHMNMNVWGQPRGGMLGLSRRLRELSKASGVDLILGVEARGLILENGAARGVVLGDGRVLRARAVLYAAPVASLPRLGGAPDMLEEWELRTLERIASETWRVMRTDYLVRRRPEPPREEDWRGTPIYVYWTRSGGGEYTYPGLLDGPGLRGLYLVQASGGVHDPMEPLPPGVEEDDIVYVEQRGPVEQERCCRNPTGHPDHIPMRDPFLFDQRPLPGWGDYRTSIPCLYHGSASSYPGGEVSGVPGFNAAARILLDLGLEPPRLPDARVGGEKRGPGERWGLQKC